MVAVPGSILALLLLHQILPAAPAAREPIAGDWVGGYELAATYTPIRVRFAYEGSQVKATVDHPMREETGVPLTDLRFEPPGLHFALPRNTGPIVFNGALDGDAVMGSIHQGDQYGMFHLVRSMTLEPELYDSYVGEYRIECGSYLSISRTRYPVQGIAYSESGSNRIGQLFATSATSFFAGPARLVPYPVEIRVSFTTDAAGRTVGLTWKPKGSPDVFARKVSLYRQEEVTFRSGEVTLAGTLTTPLTKGPFPAVVLIHGSDPHTRFTGTMPSLFALHGIAVLSYDKRGAGGSTGDLEQATFDDLAADAAAGVSFLRGRGEIKPRQVGLWGISQGGWIAPLVATRMPDLAFIILHAGPAVTPRIQARMELENTFPRHGYSPDEIQEAIAYQALYFDAMRSDEAYEKVRAVYERARSRGARWAWNPGPKETLQRNRFRLIMDYDPVPTLEKVRVPVLAFFGEKDMLVPPEGNIQPMTQALRRSGNKDVTIKLLAAANHRFEETVTGVNDLAVAQRTAPGYYETMFDWLARRVDVTAPSCD